MRYNFKKTIQNTHTYKLKIKQIIMKITKIIRTKILK